MKRKTRQWLRGKLWRENYGEGAEDRLCWRGSLSTVMKSKEEAGNKTRVEIGRSIKEKTVWKFGAETGLIWGLGRRTSKRLRRRPR